MHNQETSSWTSLSATPRQSQLSSAQRQPAWWRLRKVSMTSCAPIRSSWPLLTGLCHLALESFGGLHQNIFTLLSICARRVSNLPPDSASFLAPTFSAYWLQRISCTLMRENARLINVIVSGSLRNSGVMPDDASLALLSAGLLASVDQAQAL